MLLLPTYSLFYTLSMSPPYEGKFQTLNMWSFWDMDVVLWILHTLQFWNKLNIQKLIALYSRWHSFHTETIIFSTNTAYTFRLTHELTNTWHLSFSLSFYLTFELKKFGLKEKRSRLRDSSQNKKSAWRHSAPTVFNLNSIKKDNKYKQQNILILIIV